MARTKKPCLDCGTISFESRCPAHTSQRNAQARKQKSHLYSSEWQRLSKQQREAVPYCEECGTTEDLTADHVKPRSLDMGLRTLCRSCNSKKSHQDKQWLNSGESGTPPPRNDVF